MPQKDLTQVDIQETIDEGIKLFCVSKDQDDRDCVRKIDVSNFKNYVVETLSIPVATENSDGLMSKETMSQFSNLINEEHQYIEDYYTFPEKINCITYGNGKYVAVGDYKIYISEDKKNWSTTYETYGISVAYGNGKYVAIAFRYGYYHLLASSDGENWSEIQITTDGAQTTQILNQIIYENGQFVIVGDGGKIYTSDGTNITEISSPTSIDLKSVSSGNGIFLAVGYKSRFAVLLKSSDAVVWETISLPLELASNPYDKIEFGNGVFVIKDRRRVYVTTDGTDLTAYNTPQPPSGGDICFTDTKFFLSNGRSNFVSKNGIDWADITKEFSGKITAIKYFNNEIIGMTSENKLTGIKKYTVDGIRKDVAELNSASKWKELLTVKNQETVNLPESYREIKICVVANYNGIIYEYSNQFLKNEFPLSGSDRMLQLGGYYVDANDNGVCSIKFNPPNGRFWVNSFFIAGQNLTNSCEMVVFYR